MNWFEELRRLVPTTFQQPRAGGVSQVVEPAFDVGLFLHRCPGGLAAYRRIRVHCLGVRFPVIPSKSVVLLRKYTVLRPTFRKTRRPRLQCHERPLVQRNHSPCSGFGLGRANRQRSVQEIYLQPAK